MPQPTLSSFPTSPELSYHLITSVQQATAHYTLSHSHLPRALLSPRLLLPLVDIEPLNIAHNALHSLYCLDCNTHLETSNKVVIA